MADIEAGSENGLDHDEGPPTPIINVFIRVRPPADSGQRVQDLLAFGEEDDTTLITIRDPHSHATNALQEYSYAFDRVFQPSVTQAEIQENVGLPMLEHVFDGGMACMLSYGQTNSGKSYTVFGEMGKDAAEDERGVVPRVVEGVFDRIKGEHSGTKVEVTLSMVEVHMDQVRDIFGVQSSPATASRPISSLSSKPPQSRPRSTTPSTMATAHRPDSRQTITTPSRSPNPPSPSPSPDEDIIHSRPTSALMTRPQSAHPQSRTRPPSATSDTNTTKRQVRPMSATAAGTSTRVPSGGRTRSVVTPSIEHGSSSEGRGDRERGRISRQDSLPLHERMDGEVYVKDLSSFIVTSAREVETLIQGAFQTRSQAAGAGLDTSHTVLFIRITQMEGYYPGALPEEVDTTTGMLCFVDLAGSDRPVRTNREGILIKETLSTLGKVLLSMGSSDTTHPPYRDSKLTRLLQPVLSRGPLIFLVINLHPHADNFEECRNALAFADRCQSARPSPTINVITEGQKASHERHVQRLLAEIQDLQKQLNQQKETMQASYHKQLSRQLTAETPPPTAAAPAPEPTKAKKGRFEAKSLTERPEKDETAAERDTRLECYAMRLGLDETMRGESEEWKRRKEQLKRQLEFLESSHPVEFAVVRDMATEQRQEVSVALRQERERAREAEDRKAQLLTKLDKLRQKWYQEEKVLNGKLRHSAETIAQLRHTLTDNDIRHQQQVAREKQRQEKDQQSLQRRATTVPKAQTALLRRLSQSPVRGPGSQHITTAALAALASPQPPLACDRDVDEATEASEDDGKAATRALADTLGRLRSDHQSRAGDAVKQRVNRALLKRKKEDEALSESLERTKGETVRQYQYWMQQVRSRLDECRSRYSQYRRRFRRARLQLHLDQSYLLQLANDLNRMVSDLEMGTWPTGYWSKIATQDAHILNQWAKIRLAFDKEKENEQYPALSAEGTPLTKTDLHPFVERFLATQKRVDRYIARVQRESEGDTTKGADRGRRLERTASVPAFCEDSNDAADLREMLTSLREHYMATTALPPQTTGAFAPEQLSRLINHRTVSTICALEEQLEHYRRMHEHQRRQTQNLRVAFDSCQRVLGRSTQQQQQQQLQQQRTQRSLA
ncbi:unnamed protein product [Vitrella brassicaformis CCMP3155]|uniref:Kinesin motor domain-containing protein n=1 Tax=Vitrella brassicaformis (strain CCMP3155) TaxID=1169540 RepID=A0A0G4FWB1_VITBC|nr:unnamed protein product [Vitrella brassicaformis CCMP3155]|eukprot:CEM19270.1 unnamed protein product [Vitrella brassicaformis CCMP3155]